MAKKRHPRKDSLEKNNLKRFREEAGLVQDDACRFTSIPCVQISRLERGERDLTLEQSKQLMALYGHAIDDLTKMTPPPRNPKLVDPVFRLLVVPNVPISPDLIERVERAIEEANAEHRRRMRSVVGATALPRHPGSR